MERSHSTEVVWEQEQEVKSINLAERFLPFLYGCGQYIDFKHGVIILFGPMR
jgi:hypothetical protein